MADGSADPMRRKERRRIIATLSPEQPGPDGLPVTLTIAAVTLTIKTRPAVGVGTVVGSADIPADGFTSGASIEPEAWYRVQPTDLPLPVGKYSATFVIDCTNGDRYEPVVDFEVIADDDSP